MNLAKILSLPAGPSGPVPIPAAASLDQSDVIGHRELVELAQRLAKRKNEKHQQLGRALGAVVRGASFAARGFRNDTMRLLALEILEAYPYAAPEPIIDCFRLSLDVMAAEATPGNAAPTERELRGMLERFQSVKQAKAQTTDWLTDAAARSPTPGGALVAAPAPVPAGAALPPMVDPGGAIGTFDGFDHRNVIVIADGEYFVRHPQGREFPFHLKSKEALRIELQRSFSDLLPLRDDMGDMRPVDEILDTYASNAHQVVYDYNATAVEFDPHLARLRVGFRMGVIDRQTIEPECSERVEEWLQQLAGGSEEELMDLYDWIASTDQRWINHPATALVVVGAPNIGKTVLARAMAATWGTREPSKFAYVLDRFNGALRSCPIWHADERVPDDLSDAVFREIVQQKQRDIELKGQERCALKGCARILITLNEIDDLRIAVPHGVDAAQACADRLAIFYATPRAHVALMKLERDDAEILQVARHLRFIQTQIVPRSQRFYGGRGETHSAMAPILKATVQRSPTLFEGIADYISNFTQWEREYHIGPPSPLRPGCRFPIVAEDGLIWIAKGELCRRLGIPDGVARNWTEHLVKPFLRGEIKRISWGPNGAGRIQPWYAPLDPAKLETALGVDVVPALVHGTRRRLGMPM